MNFPGFIGPSYTLPVLAAECQRSVNLFAEVIQSGAGKDRFWLTQIPGTRLFAEGPGSFGLAAYTEPRTGRFFVVSGGRLREYSSAGVETDRGIVMSTGPVFMQSNGYQILIANTSSGIVFDLSSNTLLPSGLTGSSGLSFIDGYIISSRPGTQIFQISALYDATVWNALDFASAEGSPDNIVRSFADHEELWLFGSESIQPYTNVGNPDFPFQPIQGAFIQQGCGAMQSVAALNQKIYWLGNSSRGAAAVWRAASYAPQKISTHAVEYAMSNYRQDDAVGFTYEQNGHFFYVLTFPTANKTWVYDESTDQWHERMFYNLPDGSENAVRGRYHAFAFGKHFVLDWEYGHVYELSTDVSSDVDPNNVEATSPLRRIRRGVHNTDEQKRGRYWSMQLDMAVGVGIDGTGQGSDPKIMLRWSNDGAHTWSNELQGDLGRIGQFSKRVRWNRLGMGRDRVFEVSCTDPVPFAITAAYVNFTPGLN